MAYPETHTKECDRKNGATNCYNVVCSCWCHKTPHPAPREPEPRDDMGLTDDERNAALDAIREPVAMTKGDAKGILDDLYDLGWRLVTVSRQNHREYMAEREAGGIIMPMPATTFSAAPALSNAQAAMLAAATFLAHSDVAMQVHLREVASGVLDWLNTEDRLLPDERA